MLVPTHYVTVIRRGQIVLLLPLPPPPKKNLFREQMGQTVGQESHFLFNDYITVVINFPKIEVFSNYSYYSF